MMDFRDEFLGVKMRALNATILETEGFSDDDIQLAKELGNELYEGWKQS